LIKAIIFQNVSQNQWQLTIGGEYLAASVAQAILGFRADLIVIDNPIRSCEDAASEVVPGRLQTAIADAVW